MVVMVVILKERITNCGISTAGGRRGVLPSHVEERRGCTGKWEAVASRGGPERDGRGAHPTSRGGGAGRGSGEGTPAESRGCPLHRAPCAGLGICRTWPVSLGGRGGGLLEEGGRGGEPPAGGREAGGGRRRLRRGTRHSRGRTARPGGGARGGAAGLRGTRSSSSSSFSTRNPASHSGGIDRVRGPPLPASPPTLG